MILSELFSYIATLDSASIDLDTDGDGVIVSTHYTKVINAINLGLTDLYTEFPVKEKLVVVQLFAHITEYFLDKEYAETNTGSSQPYKYIMDTSFEPFNNDVLRVLTVSNEGGIEYPLNESTQLYSIYTPEYNVIQHPFPDDENAIFVTYTASHEPIPVTAVPSSHIVELPPQLLPLILLYINHKLLASINKEESMAKLTEYMTRLAKAKTTGLFNTEGSNNLKIEQNGWV